MIIRTLAQLRTDVLAALGFIDKFLLDSAQTRTLSYLRSIIKGQLGITTAFATAETRTLGELRGDLLRNLGFAAQVASSSTIPGLEALANEWINTAQDLLWRRLELNKGASHVPLMTADGNSCTLDYVPILTLATAMGKTHYGQPDAKAYFDMAEKWLADEAARAPPNLTDDMINAALREAQETAYRRYEMASGATFALNTFVGENDACTIDYEPIYLLTLANLKTRVGHADAKLAYEQYERYMVDLEKRMPANARSLVTQILKSAHLTLYRRYNVLHLERFFTWTLVAGQNQYEVNENDEQNPGPGQCLDVLDPREITWAGIERDGQWYPLIAGIPPECYSNNTWSAWPSRYEIRQCIELWPSPGTDVQKLRLKAHAEPTLFTLDSHTPSVDDEALYLLTCATAKQHYKQADAQLYVAQLEAFIANLTAGRHQTRRYVPGARRRADYVQPQPTVPFPP